MKQTAIVESVNGDIAKIKVKRKSACSGCVSESLCAKCLKTITTDAVNKIGAKTGDTVSIESETKTILKYAVYTFLFPVIFALAAYLITAYFLSNELISNISMLLGFVLPLIVLIIVVKNKKICDITITEIIVTGAESGVQNNE